MGLKEEMTADIDELAKGRSTEASVRRGSPKKKVDEAVHDHGTGRIAEVWLDEDGRRRSREVQGRIPLYSHGCKLCQAEDKARMAAPPTITEAELDSTVFLIPENNVDQRVVSAYLSKRYPGQELFATNTIRPARLAMRNGSKVVVVTRNTLPGERNVGPMIRHVEDKFGNLIEQPVDATEYLAEVRESAPVLVEECVLAQAATMFEDATVDLLELNLRLSDLALPRYFIAAYQRVIGSDEKVFTLRSL